MDTNSAPVNIITEKNYDSEMCGSIPLHLVNLVQPHGVLLVLDKAELRILQISENAEAWLSIPVDDILGQPLAHFVPEGKVEEIISKINQQDSQEKIPFSLTLTTPAQQKNFTAVILPQPEYILVELEASNSSPDESFINLYQQIKYITTLLKQAKEYEQVAQVAAEEIKKLSGFDKVMVYQFDPQWNGIVVGQAKEPDMDDYMGLRFPASDVPKQARDLYFRNPYRLIPTRNYKPVRLIPIINPITQRFTDLSESSLRSVAHVHLEYLANMKVTASMSLPIIIDNNLWGLISCHHKTAKHPSYEMRAAMELVSGILATQIDARQNEKDMALRVQLRNIHVQLMEQLYTSPNFAEGLLEGKTTILDLLSLSGAAVAFEGNLWTAGKTPDAKQLKDLLSWLRRTKPQGIYSTSSLPFDYPHSQAYKDVASGLIAIPLNAEQGDFILGFKSEVLQTLNWGGNPDNAIQMEPDGKTYHPRNSFQIYKQTVMSTSSPWLQEETGAAETLRNAIVEKLFKDQ
ncbi:GAF domain-containing protein [Pontibacter sp. H259]|uniref:GAF domain-containing protein n=1 Tax=Pontibacter sp. H259 TaxID=3133421 RepID=UPI0030C36E1A